jgi:chemotaxis protein CheZ
LRYRRGRFVALAFILSKTRDAMVNARFNSALQPGVNGRRHKNLRLGLREDVNVQRKVFRIEQMFGERRAAAPQAQAAGRRGELAADDIKRELTLAQEAIARNRTELAALLSQNEARHMKRAAGELGAAVDGMEKATNRILQAAETIDDSAKSLGAALKSEYERCLAQDIQEHTVLIYEACNFHDLAGQRIAKVIGIMHAVEEQLAAMLARCSDPGCAVEAAPARAPAKNGGLLNGPKLDGDAGHASQRDIDAIFN